MDLNRSKGDLLNGEADDAIEQGAIEILDDEAMEGQSPTSHDEAEEEPLIKVEKGAMSDSESIHHDNEPETDEAGSTIHVTPSIGQTEESSNQQSQPEYAQSSIPELIEAPQEIQTLLNEYWDTHGRKVPPCGTFTQFSKLNLSGNAKATWLHISGELLEPSLYRLTGVPTEYKNLDKRIVVVKGRAVGPYIVTFFCTSGGKTNVAASGSRFRIWQGVNGETPDGFEARTAVWKGHLNVEPTGDLLSQDIQILFEGAEPKSQLPKSISAHPGNASQQYTGKNRFGPLSPSIPSNITTMLEAWFAKHGRRIPPCVSNTYGEKLYKRSGGGSAYWWHKSGVPLVAKLYPLDDNIRPPEARLVVVEGEGVSPRSSDTRVETAPKPYATEHG